MDPVSKLNAENVVHSRKSEIDDVFLKKSAIGFLSKYYSSLSDPTLSSELYYDDEATVLWCLPTGNLTKGKFTCLQSTNQSQLIALIKNHLWISTTNNLENYKVCECKIFDFQVVYLTMVIIGSFVSDGSFGSSSFTHTLILRKKNSLSSSDLINWTIFSENLYVFPNIVAMESESKKVVLPSVSEFDENINQQKSCEKLNFVPLGSFEDIPYMDHANWNSDLTLFVHNVMHTVKLNDIVLAVKTQLKRNTEGYVVSLKECDSKKTHESNLKIFSLTMDSEKSCKYLLSKGLYIRGKKLIVSQYIDGFQNGDAKVFSDTKVKTADKKRVLNGSKSKWKKSYPTNLDKPVPNPAEYVEDGWTVVGRINIKKK